MKYSFVILTCFIAAFIATNNSMNAQTQKIGYVDTEVILKQLPEAQEADKKLKDIATKFQDTLVAMQKDLTGKLEQYKKQESMMTPDAKKKEEDQLKAIQQSMMQYQEEKFGNTGEIRRILLTIKEVSKDEKFNFILDKVNPALLYADDKFDLTFKVLDKIRRNSK
jgi:outer membrane protein